MRGYGQFCPVALGAEVFAERWTPLILRELLAGSHRFGELQRGPPTARCRVARCGRRGPPEDPTQASQHVAPQGGAMHQLTHRPLRLAAAIAILTVVTFLLPVGAPTTVDAPGWTRPGGRARPAHCTL
jgi:hypothetical protein